MTLRDKDVNIKDQAAPEEFPHRTGTLSYIQIITSNSTKNIEKYSPLAFISLNNSNSSSLLKKTFGKDSFPMKYDCLNVRKELKKSLKIKWENKLLNAKNALEEPPKKFRNALTAKFLSAIEATDHKAAYYSILN